MTVTALAGGVGGAKLLEGLQQVAGSDVTAIVNTGDDAEIYGVWVSPDIDIVTYRLAGISDNERGWGIAGDTFRVVEGLRALGHEAWFSLGDRDFATCIYRTQMMRAGATLSAATEAIRTVLGAGARILPMTDQPAPTRIACRDGRTLEFQEYFVRERHEPEVTAVLLGTEGAPPAPGVVEAIEGADVVVLCPSNPYLSLGPILSIPEIAKAVAAHPRVAAVSPIVAGSALKGPADKLMRSIGGLEGAAGVARLYADLCDTIAIDTADAREADEIERLGMRALVVPTIMRDASASAALAEELMNAWNP